MAKYGSQVADQAMVAPAAMALNVVGFSSSRIKQSTKIGSGAAAARLKCSAPRATSTGENPNSRPASQASGDGPTTRLASRYIDHAVRAAIVRKMTLKVTVTPSIGSNGKASVSAN